MAKFTTIDNKPKSFWKRPEGVTGTIFLVAIMAIFGFLLVSNLGFLLAALKTTIGIVGMLGVLGVIIFMALDSRTRTLINYGYKSIMRKITSLFITIDPIGILKNYVSDMEKNLKKMGKQIGELRGQMRKLTNLMNSNEKEIQQNLIIAKKAREQGNDKHFALSSRKAARLKDTNSKYDALNRKISVLHRVLSKMYTNSEILLEDTKDQVKVKEQERKAIRASHSAMKSAMSIIKGDSDKRAMFDEALEVIADDVADKIGEMEEFMDMSSSFMDSVDLQNGVFEEQGLKMLAEYEKKSSLLLLGGTEMEDTLDLNTPRKQANYQSKGGSNSEYDNMFE